MIFYDLIINEEISNLKKNFDKNFYNKFTHYLSDILSKISLKDISKNILSIFYSYNSITNKIFFP